LRVNVDDQDIESSRRQCRGNVHRGGGLSHATLLVGNRKDAGVLGPRQLAAYQPFTALGFMRQLSGNGAGIVDCINNVGSTASGCFT
jgi:hypothetical protein